MKAITEYSDNMDIEVLVDTNSQGGFNVAVDYGSENDIEVVLEFMSAFGGTEGTDYAYIDQQDTNLQTNINAETTARETADTNLQTNINAVEAKIESVAENLKDKQDKLTFDTTPLVSSANPVTSNGIYNFVKGETDGKQDRLTAGENITISDTNVISADFSSVYDTEMSDDSTNGVQNKVIKAYVDAISDDRTPNHTVSAAYDSANGYKYQAVVNSTGYFSMVCLVTITLPFGAGKINGLVSFGTSNSLYRGKGWTLNLKNYFHIGFETYKTNALCINAKTNSNAPNVTYEFRVLECSIPTEDIPWTDGYFCESASEVKDLAYEETDPIDPTISWSGATDASGAIEIPVADYVDFIIDNSASGSTAVAIATDEAMGDGIYRFTMSGTCDGLSITDNGTTTEYGEQIKAGAVVTLTKQDTYYGIEVGGVGFYSIDETIEVQKDANGDIGIRVNSVSVLDDTTAIPNGKAVTDAISTASEQATTAIGAVATALASETTARETADAALQTSIDTKATDADVVHIANTETITGDKTFTKEVSAPGILLGSGGTAAYIGGGQRSGLSVSTKSALFSHDYSTGANTWLSVEKDRVTVEDKGTQYAEMSTVSNTAEAIAEGSLTLPTGGVIYDALQNLETKKYDAYINTTDNYVYDADGNKIAWDDFTEKLGLWAITLYNPSYLYEQTEFRYINTISGSVVFAGQNSQYNRIRITIQSYDGYAFFLAASLLTANFATNDALSKYQTKLTFDTTPTADSTNPVTSGGVKTALDSKADDSDVVHLTGDETISGTKAFTENVVIDGNYSGLKVYRSASERDDIARLRVGPNNGARISSLQSDGDTEETWLDLDNNSNAVRFAVNKSEIAQVSASSLNQTSIDYSNSNLITGGAVWQVNKTGFFKQLGTSSNWGNIAKILCPTTYNNVTVTFLLEEIYTIGNIPRIGLFKLCMRQDSSSSNGYYRLYRIAGDVRAEDVRLYYSDYTSATLWVSRHQYEAYRLRTLDVCQNNQGAVEPNIPVYWSTYRTLASSANTLPSTSYINPTNDNLRFDDLVTSIDSTSSDTQVPSAKAVYDAAKQGLEWEVIVDGQTDWYDETQHSYKLLLNLSSDESFTLQPATNWSNGTIYEIAVMSTSKSKGWVTIYTDQGTSLINMYIGYHYLFYYDYGTSTWTSVEL